MKKSIVWVFGALLLAASAQAAVVVKQGQQTTKYENGYVVRLSGDSAATIDYNGVKISVPQGTKIIVRQNKNGSVRISGLNLAGVKVNETVISSKGMASFSVTNNGVLTVSRGTLTVLDAAGNSSYVTAGSSLTSAAVPAAEAVPAFVNQALEASTVSQQAVQNVVEDKVLSPSAPR